jgi:rsbT co-antagonist protein RsbR
MSDATVTHSIQLQKAPPTWNVNEGTFQILGARAAAFWLDPSLRWMIEPLVREVGPPMYRLLVAYYSSLGSKEDYESVVMKLGSTFEEGFAGWAAIVAEVGWGHVELPHFDRSARRATVHVKNAWELGMQRNVSDKWGCPFLLGKLIGIFSHALGVNCWADDVIVNDSGGASVMEIHVYASDKTIAAELERLRDERREASERPLREKIELIERQKEAIREMSTPILEVWHGVLAVPIIGAVDSERAARVTEDLLNEITKARAKFAILDLTGVAAVDTAAAGHFIQIMRAAELLGAECLVCGIQPAVAQTMASLGVGTARTKIFATMRSALMTVIQ